MSELNVLATVGGCEITDADVDSYIQRMPEEQRAYAANPYFRQQVLEQVINTKLLVKYGEELKVEESEEFAEILASIREEIITNLTINKIVGGITVTDEEVEAYYKDNAAQYTKGEEVACKHILMEDEDKILEVLASIKSGEKTFEQAAQESSTCPSGQRGGDLGSFGHGMMVPEFDQAAFAADVDAIVGPVKTQFGYHLIWVYQKQEASVPELAEVAEQIRSELMRAKQDEAYSNTLMQLRAKFM